MTERLICLAVLWLFAVFPAMVFNRSKVSS